MIAVPSWFPVPLHAAVVHMPMALAVIVPIFAIGALIVIRRGGAPRRTWAVAMAMIVALAASAEASILSGKEDGEKIERVVAEKIVDEHEEAAERFLVMAVGVSVVAAIGFMAGVPGTVARGLAAAGTVALLVGGYGVGHSGGQLVYKYGAAAAYSTPLPPGTLVPVAERIGER
jgi:hypothetical protein